MTSEKITEYNRLIALMLEARMRGDEQGEDDIMDRLDTVWYSMSAEELVEVRKSNVERKGE